MAPKKKRNSNGTKSTRRNRSTDSEPNTMTTGQHSDFITPQVIDEYTNNERKSTHKNFGKYRCLLENTLEEGPQSIDCPENSEREKIDFEELISVSNISSDGIKMDDEFIDTTVHLSEIDDKNVTESLATEIASQLSNLNVVETSDVDNEAKMEVIETEMCDHIFNDTVQGFAVECLVEEIIPVASEQEVESNNVTDLEEVIGGSLEDIRGQTEIKLDDTDKAKSKKKQRSKSRSKSARSKSKSSSQKKTSSQPKKESNGKTKTKKGERINSETMELLTSLDNSIRRSSRIKSICEKQTQNKTKNDKGGKYNDSDNSENGAMGQGDSEKALVDSSFTTSGCESDHKPVKVKSRWRRSSELEMIKIDQNQEQETEIEKTLSSDEEIKMRLKQYVHLKENQYLTGRVSCKEAKKMVCDCILTVEETEKGELGCGEDCLNRLLLIECGALCPVGDRCTNKRFQKSNFSPCEVFRTDKKGLGIRATANIPYGEFVLEYVGEVIGPDEFEVRATEYSKDKNPHYYFMSLRSDAVIDATQKGNISRFINHSCDPNAETQKWTVNGELRIGFFSKRTIIEGEEITFDYQFQRYGKEAQKCFCESSLCRGWLGQEPEEDEDEEEEEEEEEVEEHVPQEVIKVEEEIPLPPEPPIIIPPVEEVEAKPPPPPLPKPLPSESEIEPVQVLKTEEPIVTITTTTSTLPTTITTSTITSDCTNTVISPPEVIPQPAVINKEKRKLIKVLKDIFDDVDVDEELEMLMSTGLKNQSQTLKLSRLMVRATEVSQRITLLRILRRGEFPCRRLFLDYRGLRLIHGWMNEAQQLCKTDENHEALRLGILQTLVTLPIPDKTMLQDSKVLPTVELWSKKLVDIPTELDSESNSPKLENEMPTVSQSSSKIQTDCTESCEKGEIVKDEKLSEDIDNLIFFKRPGEMYEIRRSVGMDIENIRSENLWRVQESNTKLVQEIIDMFDEDMDISPMNFNDEEHINESNIKQEEPKQEARDYETEIIALALKLLEEWSVLKEVFRIPKKERVEKMKEHEREADLVGAKVEWEHNSKKKGSHRYKFPRKKESRSKSSKRDDGYRSSKTRINKHERRKLFAMRVEQEEVERRYQNREVWRKPYRPMSNDSMYTSPRNFQLMWNQQQNGQWQSYSMHLNHNPLMNQNMTSQFNVGLNYPYPIPPNVPNISVSVQNIPLPQPTMTNPIANIPPPIPTMSNMSIPPPNMAHMQQNIHRPPLVPLTLPTLPHTNIPPPNIAQNMPPLTTVPVVPALSVPTNIPPPITNLQPPILPPNIPHVPNQQVFNTSFQEKQPEKEIEVKFAGPIPPPAKLPPKWKCAKDKYGRPYYYHIKIRISQWEPPEFPSPVEIEEESSETTSSSETSSLSSDSSSEDTEDEDLDDTKLLLDIRKKFQLIDPTAKHASSPQPEMSPNDSISIQNEEQCEEVNNSISSLDERLKEEFNVLKRDTSGRELRKKRTGLVTEVHIISPRTEEDKIVAKENLRKYKENKERLKRQKEVALEQNKKRVKVTLKTPKSSRRHKSTTKSKLKESMDLNSESARKIKESFRSNMAGVMVGILNPYRKPDCKEGKITNTEDFKHLARKLTHFVMLKELKHCQNIEDLTCTESVKSKAKEFVRKYMSKFGEVYVRPTDDLDY